MTGELFRLGDLFSISVLLVFRYCDLFLSSFSQDTLSCPDVGGSGQIQSVSMPPQISQKISESDHKELQEFVIVALVPFTRLNLKCCPQLGLPVVDSNNFVTSTTGNIMCDILLIRIRSNKSMLHGHTVRHILESDACCTSFRFLEITGSQNQFIKTASPLMHNHRDFQRPLRSCLAV
jgi:hypothetical protein